MEVGQAVPCKSFHGISREKITMSGTDIVTKPPGPAIRRRRFVSGAAGLVGISILGPPMIARSAAAAPSGPAWPSIPGVAQERIDGRIKVTGQKVFARDFNARNLGWGATQWHAMYLPALTTAHAFMGVDLSQLPAEARPKRVVLGNHLKRSVAVPRLRRARDLHMEAAHREAQVLSAGATAAATATFDRTLEFDLIVQPGNAPNYLGQGVALLMFGTMASYRAARRFMQFRDTEFQTYAGEVAPSSGLAQPWPPQTAYVKYFEDGESFSYATVDSVTYRANVPAWRGRIDAYLARHPEFIRQPLSVDTQAMDPMFMEPESGLAWYDAATSRLSLLVGTQSPDGDAGDVATMYGAADSPLKVKEVVLHGCPPGGGFGGRDSSPFSLLLALTAAFSGGAPVKLMHDRWEQFRYGLKRPGARIRGTLVAGPDMKLRGIEATLDFNGGGLRNLSPYVANLAALCIGGAYEIPTANIVAQSFHTQDITGGSQRGFGGPEAFLAIETALDDLAAGKGWDPIALRRANLANSSSRTVVGGPVGQELRLAEMLDRAEAHPLWADRAAIKVQLAARGVAYGTGIAMSLQAYGTSGDGMVAAVMIAPDGRLTVRSDAVDMGNGSTTTFSVVVGPILGANAETVEMGSYRLFGETGLATDASPGDWTNPRWTAKGVGSSSACLTALHQVHTLQQTASALMQGSLLPAARMMWGRPDLRRADVDWIDGALAMRADPTRPIPRAALARTIYQKRLPVGALGHGFFQADWVAADYAVEGGDIRLQLDGLSFYMPDDNEPVFMTRRNTTAPPAAVRRYSRYAWAPCVNVVGLTVDRRDGRVQVENVLSVLNAGRVLVPELVSGQSQGGVAMAIGYTLLEDMPGGNTGPANGRWNLDRYHVPRWSDVPLLPAYRPGGRAQELIVLPESPQDGGAARGIAEAVMCSIAPAISNALRDAVGRRYTSLPITPAKVLEGLGS